MSIESKIESLLLVSSRPLSLDELAKLLEVKNFEVAKAVENLAEDYRKSERGMQIVKNGKEYQMATAPANAKIVKRFLADETTGELTRPQLETLTIIAYLGPVAKAEIEEIRGINCSLILRNLLIRGLIESIENEGLMQTEYQISFDFMKYLGIRDVKELPDYEKLSKNKIVEEFLKFKDSSQ